MLPAPALDDDATLVARALRGDERAFGTLFRRHVRHVARVLHPVLGDDAEVDRALEHGFAVAHSRLRTLGEPASFRSWVSRIALRRARRRLRARRRRSLVQQVLKMLGWSAAPGDGARDALFRTLDGLRPSLRLAWSLVELGGCTVEEAATLCALRNTTVERRLLRARALMERRLHAG